MDNAVAIATATFYRSADEVRAKLALKTVSEARELGYAVVVVDGGSPEEMCAQFIQAGAFVSKQDVLAMGPGRRQAISEAAELVKNSGVVVWMEPEKHSLVPEICKIVPMVMNGEVDLVVPSRKTMASYPPEQQYAEAMGNRAFFYLTGYDFDVWFGPRVMNQKAMRYFLDYEGEYGDRWDALFVPLLRMVKEGLCLARVDVDYVHPEEQTAAETSFNFLLKRIEQLENLVPTMGEEARKLGLIK